MRFVKLLCLLLLFSLPADAQHNPQAQAPTVHQVTYYLGEVRMRSPAGEPYGSSISLVKRTLIPAENKIIELVLSLDRKEAKEYTTVFDIKGAKFTVKDEEGSFSGEGELSGRDWAWTGWKYSVQMLGERKGTLKAEDTLDGGFLHVKKSFYSADGQLRVLFSEELKLISQEMYEILRAKLLQK